MSSTPTLAKARDLLNEGKTPFLPDPTRISGDEPLVIALLEAAWLVAGSDGRLKPQETAALLTYISTLSHGKMSQQEEAGLVYDLCERMQKTSRGDCVKQVGKRISGHEQATQVAGFALLVAMADGPLQPEERDTLEKLGSVLGLGADQLAGFEQTLSHALHGEGVTAAPAAGW